MLEGGFVEVVDGPAGVASGGEGVSSTRLRPALGVADRAVGSTGGPTIVLPSTPLYISKGFRINHQTTIAKGAYLRYECHCGSGVSLSSPVKAE